MIIDFFQQVLDGNDLVFTGHRDCVAPDEIAKDNQAIITKKIIIPEKFEADIAALRKYLIDKGETELKPGLCIILTLKELLLIAPRQRERSDAYSSLIRYLRDDLNITLTITSQKKKKI